MLKKTIKLVNCLLDDALYSIEENKRNRAKMEEIHNRIAKKRAEHEENHERIKHMISGISQ